MQGGRFAAEGEGMDERQENVNWFNCPVYAKHLEMLEQWARFLGTMEERTRTTQAAVREEVESRRRSMHALKDEILRTVDRNHNGARARARTVGIGAGGGGLTLLVAEMVRWFLGGG